MRVDRGVGWRGAAVALMTVWTALVWAPAAHAEPEDHELVYCLSPAQAQPLRDAAIALGADKAKVADLPAWRRGDAEAFEKACQALYEAQKQPPQDVLDKALPFLTGLVGALAAYVATAWQARVTAGRADRDALVAAATEFRAAALEYASTYVVNRDSARFDKAHTALLTRLRRVVAEHPSWPSAEAAKNTIVSGPLSPEALGGLSGGPGKREEAAVEELHSALDRVAAALATPGRWHRSLRRKNTG